MTPHPFSVAPAGSPVLRTIRAAGRRRLPPRYADVWDVPFRHRLGPLLRPGVSILDIGSGRRPTVAPVDRPEGTEYVGLDVEAEELERADPGSYAETVVAPAEERVPSLEGRFDLVLSVFALEHVESTERVLANAHAYLAPGGRLLFLLAGARSPFSIANRVVPAPLAKRLLTRTQGREPDSVFPARYDSCTRTGLETLLRGHWSEHEVVPLFTGVGYVLFSRALTAAYIAYEEWAVRGHRDDLAPYYLVEAVR